MLTDLDIWWQHEWNPFDSSTWPEGIQKSDYSVYAIVIDEEVVDVLAYKKSFIDLYNTHEFIEKDFSDDKYTIEAVDETGVVVQELQLSERLGAIFLSNPITVLVTQETSYANVGMKYINNEFVR